MKSLMKRGKLLAFYVVVGGGAFMLWDAESNEELQQFLSGFPMSKYLRFKAIPVTLHPLFAKK